MNGGHDGKRTRCSPWQRRPLGRTLSAIGKTPVSGPQRVISLGLVGDSQADPRVHGGVDKAVHCYPWRVLTIIRDRDVDPAVLNPLLGLPLPASWRRLFERRLQSSQIEDWSRRMESPFAP